MEYRIRDKSTPLGREMLIEDRQGHLLLRAHGPTVRIRDELHVDDIDGLEQISIKEPVLGDRKTFELYRAGSRCAVVRMMTVSNLLEGFSLDVPGASQIKAQGDPLTEFTLTRDRANVGHVRRHGTESIDVETAAGQDDTLLIASVLAMCAMSDAWARTRA